MNEFWKVRGEVIRMQRWLASVAPAEDPDVVALRGALMSARCRLEALALRRDRGQ